ncbi:hypothetical protein KIW84_013098 [Lathyrus oleraceus]|uniref:CCHC-type domain-containing protein n=1 Tax=Pisum sativum TaxID=3888 RepID=A0A9D5GX92_PEA|nr:hypothetical protein KIW84_013098 [Pisum sativum]
MDETRTSLLADDIRKVTSSGMSGNGGENNEHAQGLFATRGRTNERGQGRGGESRSKSRAHAERTCFKCGELGNFKENCPNKRVLFKKYTNNENNSRGNQDLQEASYVSNDEDDCFSISEQYYDISGRWMLDSGASHHMCPNMKWFTTYQSTNGGYSGFVGYDEGDSSQESLSSYGGNCHRDVTFDEKSLVALSRAIKPNDGDVTISNKQVIKIESEDQSDSYRGQMENPIAREDEEEDERDHEEVHQENTYVLQQQQQESLDATRPKRNYKLVQKFGSDKPLRHYEQVNLVEYALSVEDDESRSIPLVRSPPNPPTMKSPRTTRSSIQHEAAAIARAIRDPPLPPPSKMVVIKSW